MRVYLNGKTCTPNFVLQRRAGGPHNAPADIVRMDEKQKENNKKAKAIRDPVIRKKVASLRWLTHAAAITKIKVQGNASQWPVDYNLRGLMIRDLLKKKRGMRILNCVKACVHPQTLNSTAIA